MFVVFRKFKQLQFPEQGEILSETFATSVDVIRTVLIFPEDNDTCLVCVDIYRYGRAVVDVSCLGEWKLLFEYLVSVVFLYFVEEHFCSYAFFLSHNVNFSKNVCTSLRRILLFLR